MPVPDKGETREHFIDRCIPMIVKEGKTQKQAEGECYGIWDEHHKAQIDASWCDTFKRHGLSDE
jgi:hypothetical protein